jgi:hypothetical protein
MAGSLDAVVSKLSRYRHSAIDAIPDLRIFKQLKDYETIMYF